ncbi:MAG: hypothetical protein FJX76_11415 [Armatimonadetes bacterium]|nr:hypothetical protein [Armatimonadota bacterium]
MATTKEKAPADQKAALKLSLVSEEINTILAEVLGKFLVAGSPTKHGGLRFLDIESAKTFGFERSIDVENGNLLVISAPVDVKFDERDPANQKLTLDQRRAKIEDLKTAARERIEKGIKSGPHADSLHQVTVRPSSDAGKQKKLFVEVQYLIRSNELVSDKNVLDYAQKHSLTNTSEAVKRILRDHVIPMSKETMDHLIKVIRKEK